MSTAFLSDQMNVLNARMNVEFLNNRLLRIFQDTTAVVSSTMALSDTLQALENGALLAPMKPEPIFGAKHIFADEYLGRPHAEGKDFSIQKTSDQISYLCAAHDMDLLTIANAFLRAKRFPITVNISVSSVLSDDFWLDFLQMCTKKEDPKKLTIDPKNLIFEVLEHSVHDIHANTEAAQYIKKLGFRFALDDVDDGAEHFNRLELLGPLASETGHIKLDGKKCVRKKLESNPDELFRYAARLKAQYPGIGIVAEFVKNFVEAQQLWDGGIDYVQGLYLKEDAYNHHILSRKQQDLDLVLH